MFEQASRLALRFNSTKGQLTVEDLWHLPLTSTRASSLNSIAQAVNKGLKTSEEESFVAEASDECKVSRLKLDILKHIIAIKIEENKATRDAAAKKAQKQKIMELIANKKDDALGNLSIEELEAKLAE